MKSCPTTVATPSIDAVFVAGGGGTVRLLIVR